MELPESAHGIEVGSTFTRWRALSLPHRGERHGRPCWEVQCECAIDLGGCGVIKDVKTSDLTKGKSHSCGCLRRSPSEGCARLSPATKTPTPEIQTWRNIINRCHNATNSSYDRYGAIGTYVCDGWRGDQQKFVHDMGPKPSVEHSIDRIESKGHYSCGDCDHCRRVGAPMNCRWTTDDVQSRNQSRNRVLTYNGETMTVTDWTRRLGCSPAAIFGRLDRGWTVEQALGTPMLRHGLKRKWEEERGSMIAASPDHHVSLPTKQRNPNPRKPWKHIPAAE